MTLTKLPKCNLSRICPMLPSLAGLLAFALSQASAQQYTVDWSRVAGGGGRSTGGVYIVTGTIGQPDPDQASGGQFAVTGGFWSIMAAAQTPGAPLLSITPTSTNTVVISWPVEPSGWRLQQILDFSTTNWIDEGTPPQRLGEMMQVTVPPAGGSRFYRLRSD